MLYSRNAKNTPNTSKGGSNNISVRILDDGRRAEVHIPVGYDMTHLTPSLLCTIAKDAGVQITDELIRCMTAIVNDYKTNPRDLVANCAHAIEPIHGTNGTWTWEPRYNPAAMPSVIADDRRTDYHASRIFSVVAGAPIARITPPTEGTDGRSVTGAVLPARRGNAASFLPGDGLEVRPDGLVVAKIDGVLEVSKGVVTISSILNVKGSVDFSTGDIDFKGDIQVAEAVRDGFHIRATGRITIQGPVEGAHIVCGGDFTCPRGIASSRRATVEVGGNATVGYIRNATAIFRGNLACRGEIEHSTIIVGGKCQCDNSRLIGGITILTSIGHIGTIGSPQWTPTIVCLGDLPLVAMELRRLGNEAVRLQKAIAAKDEAAQNIKARGSGLSAKEREQLTELQYELSELRRKAAAVDTKRNELQEVMHQSRCAEFHVIRLIYPKVMVQHRDTAFEFVKELKGPLQILIDERGIIHLRISSQAPRPITDFARSVRPVPYWRTDQ